MPNGRPIQGRPFVMELAGLEPATSWVRSVYRPLHFIAAWCETVEDAGYSAKDLKRPGIRIAVEQLERREADALVVAKLDRLSRSMLDFTALMDRAQRQGWGIVALDYAVDTTTPAGEAMAHVLATFAQFERRLIGQRTRDALAEKKKQGVRLGRPRQLPEAVRRRIKRRRKAGQTLDAIAQELNRDGVPTRRAGSAGMRLR